MQSGPGKWAVIAAGRHVSRSRQIELQSKLRLHILQHNRWGLQCSGMVALVMRALQEAKYEGYQHLCSHPEKIRHVGLLVRQGERCQT